MSRVVVVGAGIVGAAAAERLAEQGAEVVVLDAGEPGRATYAGAGIISAPWRDPGTPLFELTRAAVEYYPGLIEHLRTGADTGFAQVGMLFIAPEGEQLNETRRELTAAGLPAQAMTEKEARAAFPYLRDDLAAVYLSQTSRVHGEGVKEGLLQAARSRGAVVRSGTVAAVGGRVVTTSEGERIEGDAVLVAAGTWAPRLVPALPIAPQRGQILHLQVAEDTAGLPVARPAGGPGHYLLPFADHRIVAGATRETGSGFDPRLTAAGVAQVLTNALSIAPGLAGATVIDQRVGLRPASADGLPILGRLDELWVATGMGAEGLTLGPYCGRLVADAILGLTPESDLEPFATEREGLR